MSKLKWGFYKSMEVGSNWLLNTNSLIMDYQLMFQYQLWISFSSPTEWIPRCLPSRSLSSGHAAFSFFFLLLKLLISDSWQCYALCTRGLRCNKIISNRQNRLGKLQAIELSSKIQTWRITATDRAHHLKRSGWPPCKAASLSANRAILPRLCGLRIA